MDAQNKLELVTRNTVELLTEQEFKHLFETKSKPIVYCGYEPSGEIHLGHLVTMQKLLDCQEAGCTVKVLFADWHAWLNKKGNWETIEKTTNQWKNGFKAAGLNKTEFVTGTSFQQKKEYLSDMLKLSIKTTINRGLRSMQEVARDPQNATISQAIYPLMQITDMKYLGIDFAEAGLEQRKIHALSREIIKEIEYQTVSFVHTPLINALSGPGEKMSSSNPNAMISIRDSVEEVNKKINKAHCIEGIIENNSVLEIARLIVFPKIKSLEIERPAKFGGNISFSNYTELESSFEKKELHPQDLKQSISQELNAILEPIRKQFK
ncbi:tyrosine--tRNA ligase [Candidatus Micrarchaeota archaeon]|nr:tyrosine--tRNA ligase [Candidatus Micrarchaeota archaeon]MBU1930306.1 tyrosine--tRNA ligase [Candidatus Micrarchaeota archaeon]